TKTRNVPELRREVPTFFNLFFVEPNILAGRRDAHQTESQTVGAVFVDQFEWIRRIAERFRHFPTELVADDAGEENVVKRNVVFDLFRVARFKFETGDDHSRHPEENNVWPGYENAGRIKLLPRLFIHRLVGPQPS